MKKLFILLFGYFLIIAVAALAFPASSTANPVSTENTENTEAELISEVTAIRPGAPFWVALRLRLREGWHTYWRNPGDTGLATTLTWSLPPGFEAGDIHWPHPEAIPITDSLMNYGYHDEVLLLVQLTPPDILPDIKPVALRVHAQWLVCEITCIPEEAELALNLPVTEAEPPLDHRWADAFARARQALPTANPWPVVLETTPGKLILRIAATGEVAESITEARFFPFTAGVIEYGAPQIIAIGDEGITLTITRGARHDTVPERVEGVLVLKELNAGTAVQAYRIDAEPAAASTDLSERTAALPSSATTSFIPFERGLLFAFLGGLILNLMPCVFPVLSIKALSLVEKSRKAPWEVRRHGMVFTLGVLASFIGIAGILLTLRTGGAQLGWGFQLQSPVFVALLAYLMFAVGLSLSGVFALGNTLMGLGNSLANRSGYLGSFATGALTTLVATPCSAPFMGIALGFALTQSWPVALLIFQTLGLGLAFPYLLLSFIPSLFRLLPRPGPWMKLFKELLAFPMYATAAWLVWVLTRQTGSEGIVTALAGFILIAFAGWLFQNTRSAGQKWRVVGSVGAFLVLVMAVGMVKLPSFADARGDDVVLQDPRGQSPVWEPFTAERLAALRAEGRPVFLNFTAAWCITCLANERMALSSPELAKAFADRGIAYLKADWTNRDPEITRMLSSFGRSGVPLYVYYAPGTTKAVILPQLLTETIVLQKLNLPVDSQVIATLGLFPRDPDSKKMSYDVSDSALKLLRTRGSY